MESMGKAIDSLSSKYENFLIIGDLIKLRQAILL